MAGIKFGVTYSERSDFTDLPAYARRVEELGFDSIWVTENISSGASSLECFTALSFIAANTSKLVLGPSVMLLPLRNPVLVAQTVVSLDILSGGRVVLGVGIGNDTPEHAAFGGNARHRASRSDEALEIIKRLWTEDSVTFHGKHYHMDDYQLVPRSGAEASSSDSRRWQRCYGSPPCRPLRRLPDPRRRDPRRCQVHVRRRRAVGP